MPRVDPRRVDFPATANERLTDAGVRHMLQLVRLSNSESRRAIRFYNQELLPDLRRQLALRLATIDERGIDLSPRTTQRISTLIEQMEGVVDTWIRKFQADNTDTMRELALLERNWNQGTLEASVPVVLETQIPTAQTINAALSNRMMSGSPIGDWYRRQSRQLKQGIRSQIQLGIAEGQSVAQITQRLRANVFDPGRRQAEAIVRSGVMHTSNVVRDEYWAENTDLVREIQWVATLDTRTCPRCMALDGKTFPVRQGARPPLHINCRCTTVPVLFSGEDLDFPASTRASMDGQVPDTMTYNDWLRLQANAGRTDRVVEALGKTRGKLFLDNPNMSVGDFVNRRGELITLAQMRA